MRSCAKIVDFLGRVLYIWKVLSEPLAKHSSFEIALPLRLSNDPNKAVLPLYAGWRPRFLDFCKCLTEMVLEWNEEIFPTRLLRLIKCRRLTKNARPFSIGGLSGV